MKKRIEYTQYSNEEKVFCVLKRFVPKKQETAAAILYTTTIQATDSKGIENKTKRIRNKIITTKRKYKKEANEKEGEAEER